MFFIGQKSFVNCRLPVKQRQPAALHGEDRMVIEYDGEDRSGLFSFSALTDVSFHRRPGWFLMLWAKNRCCHDNTAWWDSTSWNSEKPSTVSPRSLRVKRMHPRSSLEDWPNPVQKLAVDLGKANCREEDMKRYSCFFILCESTAMLVLKKT